MKGFEATSPKTSVKIGSEKGTWELLLALSIVLLIFGLTSFGVDYCLGCLRMP